jgi:hypothetical protein
MSFQLNDTKVHKGLLAPVQFTHVEAMVTLYGFEH